jgi:hypothetical protein
VFLDGNQLTDMRPGVPGFQFTSGALTVGAHYFTVTGRGLSRDAEYGGRFSLAAAFSLAWPAAAARWQAHAAAS